MTATWHHQTLILFIHRGKKDTPTINANNDYGGVIAASLLFYV